MQKKSLLLVNLSLIIFILIFSNQIKTDQNTEKLESRENLSVRQKKDLQLIPFSFVDRELTDIINFLAKKKEVNIILPQGVNTIKPDQKVTYKPINGDMITVKEAWKLLNTFLELSGYALTVESDFYIVVKNDDKLAREIFPLYINVPIKDLPNTDQRIRFVYYFSNLKISDNATWESLRAIFEDMLSPNKLVIPDPKSNGIVITDKASTIISVMRIISELDASGFKETIEIIPLFNANAEDVKRTFETLRSAVTGSDKGPFLRSDPRAEISTYFPSGTVIQTDNRTNSLIIMGRESAVLKIREFIAANIDIAPESGESILHVYDLQYLSAQDFAKVLQGIVTREGLVDQSRGGGPIPFGPERFFQGVIIAAESIVELAKAEPPLGLPKIDQAQGISGSVFSGGNRLVIAARKDDWIRIKSLIEKLDKPRPQVIIEVFIVDFTALDTRQLAGDIRNRIDCNIDTGLDFLASHISPTNAIFTTPTTGVPGSLTIATDLLRRTSVDENVNPASPAFSAPGSFVISFNDPCSGISALLQMLQTRFNTKVISRPHIVTLNNQIATVRAVDIRRDTGEAFTSGGGVPTVPIADIEATIQVQIIPRISGTDRLALEIGVDINEFILATVDQRTRRVATNCNLNSGQVLVLGGLTRNITREEKTQTPILARIPIINLFFKRDFQQLENTNLAVFIAPTIVMPKLRAGANLFTEDKVIEARASVSKEHYYSNYRDPVTRFFFNIENRAENIIEEFVADSTNAPGIEERKVVRERIKILPQKEKIINLDIKQNSGKEISQIKELLAKEDNPIINNKKSSIPKAKRKRVFNA